MTKHYKRLAYNIIKERLSEPRRFIQVVMGPRQIGKSTTVLQVLKDINIPYLYFSADSVPASDSNWIKTCWASARLRLSTEKQKEIILAIDEVQKVKNWSEYVKQEWDSDTYSDVNIKVILLGSSRVMISRGLSESLFGRYEEIRMSHWSYEEMHQAFGFTLPQFAYFGGYPGAATLIKDEKRWNNYIHAAVIDATINKDILVDSPVGKPALLRQTFELSSAYSGRLLSLTKMLGLLQDAGNTVTLSGYFNLLGDSGLVSALEKYSADIARRRASIPKYQVHNNALLGVFCDADFKQATTDSRLWGHLLESAIGTHIINESFIHRFEVFYWRENNLEVDFVLKNKSKIIAIEVKSNNEGYTKGLAEFSNRFHPDIAFIVGREGIDPETFLKMDLSLL